MLEDEARVFLRDPALHLVAARLEAGAPEESVREALPLLHPRLPERIDAGERGARDGRHLEEIEELAERERVHRGQDERGARTAALRERQLGGALLRVQQLAEGMPAQVG